MTHENKRRLHLPFRVSSRYEHRKTETHYIMAASAGATSLSKLEHDIEGITQKMLLEHLKELMEYGLVNKNSHSGYPLHVEYFLTEPMGTQISG